MGNNNDDDNNHNNNNTNKNNFLLRAIPTLNYGGHLYSIFVSEIWASRGTVGTGFQLAAYVARLVWRKEEGGGRRRRKEETCTYLEI